MAAKKYQFANTVNVDGVQYKAGDIVDREEIPSGYFESCVRVGHLVEVPEKPDAADVFAATMAGSDPSTDLLTLDPPAPVPETPVLEPAPAGPLVGPPGDPPTEPKPEPKPAEAKKPKK